MTEIRDPGQDRARASSDYRLMDEVLDIGDEEREDLDYDLGDDDQADEVREYERYITDPRTSWSSAITKTTTPATWASPVNSTRSGVAVGIARRCAPRTSGPRRQRPWRFTTNPGIDRSAPYRPPVRRTIGSMS
ncbi:hypothetical protein [Nocardia sp. NPDC019395]|uniref:hypothetical protein n=1 Tax=Nocardia sp. NPDC019395 TaxID=3154686 RepID=UPI0033E00243